MRLTIDRPVATNPHHASRYIDLLAKLDAPIKKTFLILGGTNGTLDPAWRHIVDADALLMARTANSSHETAEAVLGGSILPIPLYVTCQNCGGVNCRTELLTGESIQATIDPVMMKHRSRSCVSGCFLK